MNLFRSAIRQLRNRDLALLETSEHTARLTAEELALLKRGREVGSRNSQSLLTASFVVFCFLGVLGAQIIHERARRAYFTVDGMCCEFAVKSATDKLSALPGVVGITPRYSEKSLEVSVECGPKVSAKKLWDAFHGSPVRPVRLAYHGNTYRDRPSN